MKKNIYLYKLALLFLIFIGFTNTSAQEKPADSLVSVRTDFSLADEEFNPICLQGKHWEFIKEDIEEAVSKFAQS